MTHRARSILFLVGGVAAALTAAALAAPRDLVLYNPSPSVPEGLYVRTDAPVAVGAFVTVRARDVAPEEARRRGFDDASDRFIKRVAAAAGARVCGDGRVVVISGDDIVVLGAADADADAHDGGGAGGGDGGGGGDAGGGGGGGGEDGDHGDHRRHHHRAAVAVLPAAAGDARPRPTGWQGCRVLASGEVLLLGDTEDSFDGRYWGPVSVDLIEGVWRRL